MSLMYLRPSSTNALSSRGTFFNFGRGRSVVAGTKDQNHHDQVVILGVSCVVTAVVLAAAYERHLDQKRLHATRKQITQSCPTWLLDRAQKDCCRIMAVVCYRLLTELFPCDDDVVEFVRDGKSLT